MEQRQKIILTVFLLILSAGLIWVLQNNSTPEIGRSSADATTSPTPYPQYPSAFPDCLVLVNKGSEDPNFGSTTEHTIPEILRDRPNAQLIYKVGVFNNCPWDAHLEILTDASTRASFDTGVGKRTVTIPPSEFAQAFTQNLPADQNIPSCWNSGSTKPADCERDVSIQYNFNTYTCGSLGISISWKHLKDGGKVNDPQGLGIASALNYGRDCTGTAIERAPGKLSSSTSATPPAGGSACQTPSPGTHVASVLTVQCGSTQNVLTWTLPSDNDTNAILKNIDGGNGSFLNANLACHATLTYTDTAVSPGQVYQYRHKAFADKTSNTVTCPSATTTSVTPTPSGSSTVYPILQCAPISQIVSLNQPAQLLAQGGNGVYAWTVGAGAISGEQTNGNDLVAYSWVSPGLKVITVRSAGQSTVCNVLVVTTSVSPTPGFNSNLILTKKVRNITTGQIEPAASANVDPDQSLQFIITLTPSAGRALGQVVVRDTSPRGMSYQLGSTLINGSPSPNDEITTGTGLVTQDNTVGENLVIRWTALADRTAELATGRQVQQPQATVSSPNGFLTALVEVNLLGTGTGASGDTATGPAGVATGPGDAVALALTLATTLTLLYTAYTRSPSFRRKEISQISKDQGPMDFRS